MAPAALKATLRKRRVVVVNDRMQRDYRYERVVRPGRDFDPEFKPELTPKQMLRLGVFGGKYLTDCRQEFPRGRFQWYCRYWMGCRMPEECDHGCRPRQRQALLHWAYDSRKV